MISTVKKKISGFSILILTITLLLISTLLILFTTQYSNLQQKITANIYQNQQAIEAAQAGIEAAIPYFQANYAAIVAAGSAGYLQPYVNSNTSNVALANGSTYTFVFSNPTANNYQLITITATGTSANGNSTRILKQQIQSYSSGIPIPTVTLSSKGNITLSNSASLNNSQTNSNVSAGGTVTFHNSAKTTTSSGTTSSTSGIGGDVSQNNSTLSSMSNTAYFESIFGTTQSTVQSAATYNYSNSGDTNYNSLNGVTGAVIWITQTAGSRANFTNNTVIGSAARPVIIIVDGNLDIANNVTIYGLVFNMNASSSLLETNSVTINGAIATTSNITFSNSASLNYSSSILNALPSVTGGGSGSGNYAKVPASWRDF